MCGENSGILRVLIGRMGSPPRVREKLIGWENWVGTGSIPTQRFPQRVREKLSYYITLKSNCATEDVDMIQLFAGVDHRRVLGVLGQEL